MTHASARRMANGPAKVPPADVSIPIIFLEMIIYQILEKMFLKRAIKEITRSLKSSITSLDVCSLIKNVAFRNKSMGLFYIKFIVA